jgi:hypothetical protein
VCLKNLRSSAHRALLIALAACPAGGALVATGVTRDLVFVVPAALLSGLGLATVLAPLARGSRYRYAAALVFAVLVGINIAMLRAAVVGGPTWYHDYGLYGMQYGGRQVTAAVRQSLDESPRTRILLSPSWANGTDVIVRFFLQDEPRVRLGSIDGYISQKLDIPDNQLFVMTVDEFDHARRDRRFADIRVEKVLAYPDGRPGFYFVRLRYSRRADVVFAAERRARTQLVHQTIVVDGEPVSVAHSRFDSGRVRDLFDDDVESLAQTRDANAFRHGRVLRGVAVTIGSMRPEVRVTVTSANGTPLVFSTRLPDIALDPTLTLSFGRSIRGRSLEVRVRDLDAVGPTHVHVREIQLR